MTHKAAGMRHAHTCAAQRQKGIALFIVVVLVMLSMLLALWASRSALFNEMFVGNDADYQRALEAAQALLQDAELDIRGEQASGAACAASSSQPSVCRSGAGIAQFPRETGEVGLLLASLAEATPTGCRDGLCTKRTGPQDFWNNADEGQGITLGQMTAADVGARYGQFTGAIAGGKSDSILANREAGKGGWYWIEILPYDVNAGNSGVIANGSPRLALYMQPQVIYRITAIAHGRKSNTQVVMQQTYSRQKRRD
ncbi:pilus assembly PilX family protein [Delftia tsuruhatensis]|uniref:pilus assembly PilX family protein n=1 Tax=Delftia tsuruhatensis TaxID=180282 RepID=UPI00370ADDD4